MPDSFPAIPPYLVEEVIPSLGVHLLGGVSDAGKTRFIVPAMLAWQEGQPFLGRKSHPRPWAYVIGDRSIRDATNTMADMGIDINTIPRIPAFGKDKKNINEIINAAQHMSPRPELLVWEGFQDFAGGEKKAHVQEFLSRMTAYCEDDPKGFPNGLTILGIVESPKLKPAERYPNPRHRISGVSAWGYHSSTIILIENVEGDPSLLEPRRVIWICAKNAKRREVFANFDMTGRLLASEFVVPKKKVGREPVKLVLPIR